MLDFEEGAEGGLDGHFGGWLAAARDDVAGWSCVIGWVRLARVFVLNRYSSEIQR